MNFLASSGLGQTPLRLCLSHHGQKMRNTETWKPTKFIKVGGALRISPDPAYVSPGSRFIGGLQAGAYDTMIRLHAHGALLDVGAGRVPLYAAYSELTQNVLCIDWDNSLHNLQHIDIFTDLTARLPLVDQSFNTILCTDVLEHLPTPDVAMREFARLLAPGGKLLLATPFMYWLHEEPHDYHRYTEHRLRMLCQECGLDVLSINPIGGGIDVVIDVVSKCVQRSLFTLRCWLVFAKALTWVANRLDRKGVTRRRMPLGYTLVARRPISSG